MSSPHLIAYHANCTDGQIAAFVTWSFTGRKADTVSVNYDLHKKTTSEVLSYLTKDFSKDQDFSQCSLTVVDFSFSYQVLLSLGQVFKKVMVIDHHKTAQDDLDCHIAPVSTHTTANGAHKTFYKLCENVSVWFCMEESGALMAWRYYAGEEAKVADFVRYTSDRDLWKFLDPKTRPFTSGMGLHRTASWMELEVVLEDTAKVITQGEVIEAIRAERVRSILSKPARLMRAQVEDQMFEIGCYNAPPEITSDLLSEYVNTPGNYPVGMTYTIDSEDIVYCSIRSTTKINCSVIAKVLGGGGHPQACGFIVPLKQFMEMLQTQNLTGIYPPPSKVWGYRRYGSNPQKGYTLLAGGSPIAYLGDGIEAEMNVEEICSAHNATL